jgi:hypothetical protein
MPFVIADIRLIRLAGALAHLIVSRPASPHQKVWTPARGLCFRNGNSHADLIASGEQERRMAM